MPTTTAVDASNPESDTAQQYGRVVYTVDGLSGMNLKQLKDICRSRDLVMRGKKEDLLQRILTSQLGPYPGKAAGP